MKGRLNTVINVLRKYHDTKWVTCKKLIFMVGLPNTCYICGLKIEIHQASLDHVYPISRGGRTVKHNLRWTHRACNFIKRDMTPQELKLLAEQVIVSLKKEGW